MKNHPLIVLMLCVLFSCQEKIPNNTDLYNESLLIASEISYKIKNGYKIPENENEFFDLLSALGDSDLEEKIRSEYQRDNIYFSKSKSGSSIILKLSGRGEYKESFILIDGSGWRKYIYMANPVLES